jgi:DUF4097 and DUF4098 domain-containing protein YvlB
VPADVPPGFRRLTQPAGLTVEERTNEISITSSQYRGRTDLEIQVPSRTNLRLTSLNGDITVDGVEGEIEVTSTRGDVTLTSVSGAVVAQSMNGAVVATLSRAPADKAMSFTTFNGGVDVTLPASIKANLKMLSYQGDVYTDFDLQLKSTGKPTPAAARPGEPATRFEINDAIYGSINGGGPEIELRTYRGRILLRKGP